MALRPLFSTKSCTPGRGTRKWVLSSNTAAVFLIRKARYLEVFQPIYTGNPVVWLQLMRVNVVHAGCVPGIAADRGKHRRFRQFVLFVGRGGEFIDRERADLLAVNRDAVLGEANGAAVEYLHSSARARDAFVTRNQWTGRMFGPTG